MIKRHAEKSGNPDLLSSTMHNSGQTPYPVPAPRPKPRPRPHSSVISTSNNYDGHEIVQQPPAPVIKSPVTNRTLLQTFREDLEKLNLCKSLQGEKLTIVTKLLQINVDFNAKYEALDMLDILRRNESSDLMRIPTALGVLEQYACNLLKPARERHQSWRVVQFSSKAFETKLSFMTGCKDVLQLIGYTQELRTNPVMAPEGMSFPLNVEPNHGLVLKYSVDLTIGKFEVEAILNGTHPRFNLLRRSKCLPEIYYQTGIHLSSVYSKETADPISNKERTDPISNEERTDPISNEERTDPISNKERTDSIIDVTNAYERMSTPSRAVMNVSNQIQWVARVPDDQKKKLSNHSAEGPRLVTSPTHLIPPQQQQKQQQKTHIFCSWCGQKCNRNSRFCHSCGESLQKGGTPPQEVNTSLIIEEINEKIDPPQSQNEEQWVCHHCTFLNAFNAKVCGMCDKTSWIATETTRAPKETSDEAKEKPGLSKGVKLVNTNEEDIPLEIPRQLGVASNNQKKEPATVDKKKGILGSQTNSRNLLLESPSYEQKDVDNFVLINLKTDVTENYAIPEHYNVQYTSIPGEHGSKLPIQNSPFSTYTPPRTNSHSLPAPRKDGSANMFTTAPANSPYPKDNIQEVRPIPNFQQLRLEREMVERQKQEERRRVDEMRCQNAIERQRTMKANAKRLVDLFKFIERHDFTVEECLFATRVLGNYQFEVIKNWLECKMNRFIQNFVTKWLETYGKDDTIGLISFSEAKTFLIECKGDERETLKTLKNDRITKVNNLYNKLNMETSENFTVKMISDSLWKCEGDEEKAKLYLLSNIEELFTRIYLHGNTNTSQNFYDRLKDEKIDLMVRCRMLVAERDLKWGRASNCINLIEKNKYEIEDCIVACQNNMLVDECEKYLSNECKTCYMEFPMHRLVSLTHCDCRLCYDCFAENVKVVLTEKHIRHLVCPICDRPKLDGRLPPNYFDILGSLINYVIKIGKLPPKLLDTYEIKLRDFSLLKEKNFRWCLNCSNGFLWDGEDGQLCMTCNRCKAQSCFLCKEKWEDQHFGISCKQFKAWKIQNDPELQNIGVQALLSKNGVECPDCKFKYDLARGGCIHFTCRQCGFQFCNGCDQEFTNKCNIHPDKGLHAHHPRDCLYYLRDYPVETLQKLLSDSNIEFDIDIPEGKQGLKCDMMLQKEVEGGLKDEECGQDIEDNMAGICGKHYLEYLVALINRNGLDPIDFMTTNEIEAMFKREAKQFEAKKGDESEEAYLQRIRQFSRDHLRLPVRKERIKPLDPAQLAVINLLPAPALPQPFVNQQVAGNLFDGNVGYDNYDGGYVGYDNNDGGYVGYDNDDGGYDGYDDDDGGYDGYENDDGGYDRYDIDDSDYDG